MDTQTTDTTPRRLLIQVPLKTLTESPTNPRGSFDPLKLEELAQSMQDDGLIQPIAVRQKPGGGHEIVVGHRRARAARHLGWEAIDAVVRDDLDDVGVAIAQVVENDMRVGATPLEESDAIVRMLNEHHIGADELAARLGKSPGYVRRRRKLQDLHESMRLLLSEGRIGVGSAEALSGLHLDAQAELAQGDLNPARMLQGKPKTFTGLDVSWAIKGVSRTLERAPFALDDPFGKLGPCVICPRRTGSQLTLLLSDCESGRCLDAACWQTKVDRTMETKEAELVELGLKAMGPEQLAEKKRDYTAFVSVGESCWQAPVDKDLGRKPTWGELAADGVTRYAFVHFQASAARIITSTLVRRRDVEDALKEAGDERYWAVARLEDPERARARELARREDTARRNQVVERVRSSRPTRSALLALARAMTAQAAGWELKTVAKSLGRPDEHESTGRAWVLGRLGSPQATVSDAMAVLALVAMGAKEGSGQPTDGCASLCADFGVDVGEHDGA